MVNRCLVSTRTLAVAIAVSALTSIGAAGQAPASKGTAAAQNWTQGMTPDGQPDFQGTWLYFDNTPFETPGVPTRRRDGETVAGSSDARVAAQRAERVANGGDDGANIFYSEGAIRTRGNERRRSMVVFPADGHVPILPVAAERNNERQDHVADSYKYMTALTRCIARGVPAIGFPYAINNAVQIIQGPGYVGLVYEMLHDTRIIPLNGAPHLASNVHLWDGDSRGHWEGNTLVIDTTNFNDKGSVTNSAATGHLLGITQSEALHVEERFTRVGADTIRYDVTIEDPGVYSGPWKVSMPLTRNNSYKIFEYGCHEGNQRFMAAALGAGRVADGKTSPESASRRAAEEAAKASGK